MEEEREAPVDELEASEEPEYDQDLGDAASTTCRSLGCDR
jgi:hypothetical protein